MKGEREEKLEKRMEKEMEKIIMEEGKKKIEDLIGEKVMGEGGVVVKKKKYWEKVKEVIGR